MSPLSVSWLFVFIWRTKEKKCELDSIKPHWLQKRGNRTCCTFFQSNQLLRALCRSYQIQKKQGSHVEFLIISPRHPLFVLPDRTGNITPHSSAKPPFGTRNPNICLLSSLEPLSEVNLFFMSDAESLSVGSDTKPLRISKREFSYALRKRKKIF